MKRVLYLFLLTALTTYTTHAAADEAAESPQPPADAAMHDAVDEPEGEMSPEARLEESKQRFAEAEKEYATFDPPSRTIQMRFERSQKIFQDKVKSLEKKISELNANQQNLADSQSEGYEFSIIPVEEREAYAAEGTKLGKDALRLLSSKVDADQVEGLAVFDTLRENYRGIPQFKEALTLAKKASARLEKKWKGMKDRIEKSRENMPAARLAALEKSDDSQFSKLEAKLKAEGKDISKDWFLPLNANLPSLDRAVARADKSLKEINRIAADVPEGNAPQLIAQFWTAMDAVCELMTSGQLAEAELKLTEDESLKELKALGRNCIPDDLDQRLNKQRQALKDELRKRVSGSRTLQNKVSRDTQAMDREFNQLEQEVSRLMEAFEREHENVEKRAEAAAAKAAAEAERKAREEQRKQARENAHKPAESADADDEEEDDEEEEEE